MSKRKHALDLHFQQGLRLHAAGRLRDAEQVYRQVLNAAPGHADSLHMLGVLALQSGQADAALSLIEQAIARQPTAAMYQVNRANALLAANRPEEAAVAAHTALRHKRNCAEASQVLGHALCDLNRPAEAVEAYQAALRHNPRLAGLHNNLGLALRQAGRLDEAAAALRQAVAAAPGDRLAQSNLAGVLKELGQLSAAEALYEALLQADPDDPALHYHLGLVLLQAGRFDEGWSEYEWRFRAGAAQLPDTPQPLWQGEALEGRSLLIRAEQGLGDMIQFCRYAPLVTGGNVFLEVHRPLLRLLSGLRGAPRLVPVGDPLPEFDLSVPLLSLPRLLGTPLDTAPYLHADPERIAAWRPRLGDGFRIGVAWQGNPASAAELGRSYPLAALLPLAQLPGVRLISLQKHDGLAQLASAPPELRIETLGSGFDSGPDAFLDTAAVMSCVDLVVTSDTSIAHLAGAMGRPVWVALQLVPDWRWQLQGEECAWYPTMRLFRQTVRGDWSGVFRRMAEELAR